MPRFNSVLFPSWEPLQLLVPFHFLPVACVPLLLESLQQPSLEGFRFMDGLQATTKMTNLEMALTQTKCGQVKVLQFKKAFLEKYMSLSESGFLKKYWKIEKLSNVYGGFLKWWYPTTIGVPTKNWSWLGVWNGGIPPFFQETPKYN